MARTRKVLEMRTPPWANGGGAADGVVTKSHVVEVILAPFFVLAATFKDGVIQGDENTR